MSGNLISSWSYSGPVARAYQLSRAPVAAIVGPTGGGKTTASCRRPVNIALWQHRSPRDGIRKARIVCVAPTYRDLWDKAIPSWKKVWPEDFGRGFKGSKGDPAEHIFDLNLSAPHGTTERLHIEMWFRAIREESLEEFVRGLEATAFWFPEMDTHPAEDLLSLAGNRVPRYPEPDDRPDDPSLPPAYAGVYGDANAPVVGSWFHKRFYLAKRPADRFFLQPSGFSPQHENAAALRKLHPNYYADLASRMAEYDVGRLIRCNPGYSRNGKPVHEHFDHQRMVAPERIDADPLLELVIGADAGNTLSPAATFAQRSFDSQWRFLAEIHLAGRQMDMVEFGKEIRRVKDTRFPNVRRAVIYVDPSAIAKSAHNRMMSFAQIVQGAAGIEVRLAPSNDLKARFGAIDQAMKRSVGFSQPGIWVDPGCLGLIEAWSGGYRFKKHGDVYSPTPEKSPFSHVAESAQYAVLGGEGLGGAGGFIHPHGSAVHDAPQVIF